MHVTVTEINYSDKDKALQLTTRIFIDDLESAIRAIKKEEEMDLLEPGKGRTTDQLVKEYLNTHLKIKVDGKLWPLSYLGSEKEDLALVCYIELANVKKMKTLEVTNNVLLDLYDDQSNLVHVTYKAPVKSARLVHDKPTEVFKFGK